MVLVGMLEHGPVGGLDQGDEVLGAGDRCPLEDTDGDTGGNLARRMATLNRGPELFYILNNLFPGDPLVAGGKYKIVVVK